MLSKIRKKFENSKLYKFIGSHIKMLFTVVVLLYLGNLFLFCCKFPSEAIKNCPIAPISFSIMLFFVIFVLIIAFANANTGLKDKDKVFVLLCCVITLIIIFSTLYVFINIFDCDAFNIGCKSYNAFDKMINMLYFSTMTLTTVGYGDIYPVSNLAKIVVSIEAVTFTVIISFIIMNFTKSKGNKEKDTQQNKENTSNE